MRSLYIVSYDISDPKALRQIGALVRAYCVTGQKSFCECLLTPSERDTLIQEVEALMNHQTDRFAIFALDPRAKIFSYGQAHRPSVKPFLIV